MSIDPLDRTHDQQPVPGQTQNPSQPSEPTFVTDNPDIPAGAGQAKRPAAQPPATPARDDSVPE